MVSEGEIIKYMRFAKIAESEIIRVSQFPMICECKMCGADRFAMFFEWQRIRVACFTRISVHEPSEVSYFAMAPDSSVIKVSLFM